MTDQAIAEPVLNGGHLKDIPHTDSEHQRIQNHDSQEAENKERRRNLLRMIRHIGIIAVLDIGLPIAVYFILQTFTTQLIALVVSSIPPLLRMIYILLRYRRLDYLNAIFVVAFALSAILSAINGDVRVALLRDAILTGAIGLCFLITLTPLSTRWITIYPMTHAIGRHFLEALPRQVWTDADGVKHEMALAEWMWKEMQLYRRHNYLNTTLWGSFLLADFGVRLAMIFMGLDTDRIVWAGTVMIIVIAVTLGVFGAIQFGYLRRKCIRFSQEWKAVHDFSHRVTAAKLGASLSSIV